MSSIEQCLECSEKANDVLCMQNHVLTTALKDLIRSLSPDMANDAVKPIQLTFEDALAELSYEGSSHIDLFHDITYAFFREKDH